MDIGSLFFFCSVVVLALTQYTHTVRTSFFSTHTCSLVIPMSSFLFEFLLFFAQ